MIIGLPLNILIFIAAFLAIIALGTLGFVVIEGMSLIDAFYLGVVTITTVGYGDIIPNTDTGKLFATFLIIMGVGTFLGMVANATEMMLKRREKGDVLIFL